METEDGVRIRSNTDKFTNASWLKFMRYFLTFEVVAKLQCMEKTMILDQFTSRAAAESPAPEHILGGVGFGCRVVK
jgi:hypothetical protein